MDIYYWTLTTKNDGSFIFNFALLYLSKHANYFHPKESLAFYLQVAMIPVDIICRTVDIYFPAQVMF